MESAEAIGGYPFFEANDLDAAIALASRTPAASVAAQSSCARSRRASDHRGRAVRGAGLHQLPGDTRDYAGPLVP
ncbi:MAG: hypothetical protein ACLP1Q_14750, partial [Solirubrobacteraceae bacterium]